MLFNTRCTGVRFIKRILKIVGRLRREFIVTNLVIIYKCIFHIVQCLLVSSRARMDLRPVVVYCNFDSEARLQSFLSSFIQLLLFFERSPMVNLKVVIYTATNISSFRQKLQVKNIIRKNLNLKY